MSADDTDKPRGEQAPERPPRAERSGANAERPDPVRQPDGEVDGPKGPEPTRYGDWEKGGRVSDF
ncbi:succinate dehydrogenase assembly factor 4 [Marinivivus vitaminiproducens]|uniref:succinate dehydrogenase assembly factor 4 n=1 Tax=Marinivivus vitaminiproducens TaxID=3035935 RepID=UPI00279CF9FB|nr:DUF1674 domain-containing protein [Geminicoccaceae bacterium SCSIO 64248]